MYFAYDLLLLQYFYHNHYDKIILMQNMCNRVLLHINDIYAYVSISV